MFALFQLQRKYFSLSISIASNQEYANPTCENIYLTYLLYLHINNQVDSIKAE